MAVTVVISAPSSAGVGEAFTVSGRAYEDGRWLGYVDVNIYVDGSFRTTTRTSEIGEYSSSIRISTAGTHTLRARCSGEWSSERTITIEAAEAPFIEVRSPSTATPGETFLVSGIVYDSTTGDPYPGTSVGCHYDGMAFGSDVTDIDGIFEISGSIPSVGTYTIRANAKGVIGSTTISIQEYVPPPPTPPPPTPPPAPPPAAPLYEVRFACIPGVPGVKCTLDGAVKYSDSSGLASFYGVSQGSHSYSVEAPEGWSYVSGEDTFGRPLPLSGTTVIEWVPYPEVPYPEEQPWMMLFNFEVIAPPPVAPPVAPPEAPPPPPEAPEVTVALEADPETQQVDQPISFTGTVTVEGVPEADVAVEIREASTNELLASTYTGETGYYYMEWTPTSGWVGSYNVWAIAKIDTGVYSSPVLVTVTGVEVPPPPAAPPAPAVPPVLPTELKYLKDRFEAIYYVLWDIKEEIRPITIKANTYTVRNIDLSTARSSFETIYTPGFALTVLKCTGTMDLRIGDNATDSITIEPILYPQMLVIDRMDFDKFYVRNSVQPGKEATIIIWRRQ